jgi:hypothetical protein
MVCKILVFQRGYVFDMIPSISVSIVSDPASSVRISFVGDRINHIGYDMQRRMLGSEGDVIEVPRLVVFGGNDQVFRRSTTSAFFAQSSSL